MSVTSSLQPVHDLASHFEKRKPIHCPLQEFVETGIAHSQAGVNLAFDQLKGVLFTLSESCFTRFV